MKTKAIKRTLGNNRALLFEAIAILKLIDSPEDTDHFTNLKNASRVACRIVDQVNDSLDVLETALYREGVQSWHREAC
ncbi:MAG: hypothetical protein ABFS22_05510 [Pseudomonadota bacterium]